jgi:hypothetical protein
MSPGRIRVIGIALAVLSAAALVPTIGALMSRLQERNWYYPRLIGEITTKEFIYEGHRGSIERVPPIEAGVVEGVEPVLRVNWRGQSVDFPLSDAGGEFPLRDGMLAYREWLAVLLIVDGSESREAMRTKWEAEQMGLEGGVTPRLIIAGRYLAPDYDPGSWGLVRRKEWHYRIAQLHTDGPDEEAIELWDKTYEELDAILAPGKYTKPEYNLPLEQRQERMWMHYAMLEVTPANQYRGRNKVATEVVESMGWPWPAAVASVMGILIGIAVAASANLQRVQGERWDDVQPGVDGPFDR